MLWSRVSERLTPELPSVGATGSEFVAFGFAQRAAIDDARLRGHSTGVCR